MKVGTRWEINTEYVEDWETGRVEAVKLDPPIVGPRDCDPNAKLTTRFRLYGDDGDLVLSGMMSDDCEFDPLDDYGGPSYGCTELRFYDTSQKRWITL
jgi:hypothetical protein